MYEIMSYWSLTFLRHLKVPCYALENPLKKKVLVVDDMEPIGIWSNVLVFEVLTADSGGHENPEA